MLKEAAGESGIPGLQRHDSPALLCRYQLLDVGLDRGSRGTICRFQRQRFLAHAFDGYRARWGTFVLREVLDGKLKGPC